ncbi:hypothetical protein FRB99_006915 [Tulasnella sp. 403]|nr:hypothetical protein FRB99_006915 [Tulasnella sp. 403]
MVIVSSVPGTVPRGGFVTVSAIQDTAKRDSNTYRGVLVLSMINAARRAAEQGIQKEEAGDIQNALLKYYRVSHMLKDAMQTSEYTQEATKHGAIRHEVDNLARFFGEVVQPRILGLEMRLQEVERPRVESASHMGQLTVPNGNTTTRPTIEQQIPDGDQADETTRGSLAGRMRKLQATAGMHAKTAHPSTPTSKSVSPSIPTRLRQTSGNLSSHPLPSLPSPPSTTPGGSVVSSSPALLARKGQNFLTYPPPATSMQPPTSSVGSPPFDAIALSTSTPHEPAAVNGTNRTSSSHTFMTFASDQRIQHTNAPDLASSSCCPIEWTTFCGSPNESISTLIQTVQRVALSQSMHNDGAWMAAYAASCFSEEALSWYNSLDSDVQTSWALLRPALLQKYPITAHALSPKLIPTPAAAPVGFSSPSYVAQVDELRTEAAPPQRRVTAQDLSLPRKGYIQLVESTTGLFQGYLSKQSGIVSTRAKMEALIVELPSSSSSGPIRIRMERKRSGPINRRQNHVPETAAERKFNSLGLRKNEEWSTSTKSWVLCPCTGEPPSGKDRVAQGRRATPINYPDRYCASSAVWTVHPIGAVVELKLLWTKDNGTVVRLHIGRCTAVDGRLSGIAMKEVGGTEAIPNDRLLTVWRKLDSGALKDFRRMRMIFTPI